MKVGAVDDDDICGRTAPAARSGPVAHPAAHPAAGGGRASAAQHPPACHPGQAAKPRRSGIHGKAGIRPRHGSRICGAAHLVRDDGLGWSKTASSSIRTSPHWTRPAARGQRRRPRRSKIGLAGADRRRPVAVAERPVAALAHIGDTTVIGGAVEQHPGQPVDDVVVAVKPAQIGGSTKAGGTGSRSPTSPCGSSGLRTPRSRPPAGTAGRTRR